MSRLCQLDNVDASAECIDHPASAECIDTTAPSSIDDVMTAVRAIKRDLVDGRDDVAASLETMMNMNADSANSISQRISVIEQQNAQILEYLRMIESHPLGGKQRRSHADAHGR